MANTIVVTVDHLVTEADMRLTKALTLSKQRIFQNLRNGHVVLMLNRRGTIARFVDAQRGIYTMYAPEGERYDVATIEQLVNDRLLSVGLRLLQGRGLERPKRVRGLSLPPPKKKAKKKAA